MTPPALTDGDYIAALAFAVFFVALPVVVAWLSMFAARRDRASAARLPAIAEESRVAAMRREQLALALLTHLSRTIRRRGL
jgi:hypothetical protein